MRTALRPLRRLLRRGLPVFLLAGAAVVAAQSSPRAQGPAHPAASGGLPARIVNDTLGVSDHCTSCHTGLLDPSATGAEEPTSAHPGAMLDRHPPLRYGCVICHGGNGAATDRNAAHRAGGRSVATGHAVEIACARCHVNETRLEGAPYLSEGRRLIRRLHCAGCHTLRDIPPRREEIRDLHGVGDRTSPEWCFAWLRNPKDYAENARMPRFVLEPKWIDALVGYLMTFRDSSAFDTTRFANGDPDRGKTLFRLSFCISCHTVNGKGADEAIDLARVGNKLTRPALLRQLAETHRASPGTAMPQYTFTDGQIADLAAYMQEDFYDPDFAYPEEDSTLARIGTFWPSDEERVDVGRRLFKELRCGNCHRFPGDSTWIDVGPDLTQLDENSIAQSRQYAPGSPASVPDFVLAKVLAPRRFEPVPHRLKMPNYDLDRESALEVSLAVFAQTGPESDAQGFIVRSSLDDSLGFTGEFGALVDRYRCYSCHSFNGRGHNTTYDLGVEGSRVQRSWLTAYLKAPYTLRPLLTLRMPKFNLSDHEAQVLADGLLQNQKSPEIDGRGTFDRTADMVGRGKALFEESGCLSCHQMNGKGGYVGPSFTAGSPVGRKLTPGWIVTWLQDPRALLPTAIEPRYGFTEAEREAVAAYLLSVTKEEKTP